MNTEKKHVALKYDIIALVCMAAGVLLDQWSKHMAVLHLKGQEALDLIPGVFQLTYLENHGAAFGMLQGQQLFFFLSTILILGVVVLFYIKAPFSKKFIPLRICAVMIASGAVGNFLDRIRLNYVVDFFYVELIDFPVFNVADIFVTVSTIMLIILILFYYKEEDLGEIFHSRKRGRDEN